MTLPTRMIGSPLDIDPNPAHAAALARHRARAAEYEPRSLLDGPEHVIFGGRQEGKTRLAMRWLQDAPAGVRRVLVTITSAQADELKQQLGLPSRDDRVLSYRQLQNRGIEHDTEYGIDEAVRILVDLLGLREPPRLITLVTAAPWQGTPAEDVPVDGEPLLRYFDGSHLPEGPLAEVSRLFRVVAARLVASVPRSPERTVALRKLLESKDAAVRAALDVDAG